MPNNHFMVLQLYLYTHIGYDKQNHTKNLASVSSWTARRTSPRGPSGSRTSLLCIERAWKGILRQTLWNMISFNLGSISLIRSLDLFVCVWVAVNLYPAASRGARLASPQVCQHCHHRFTFLSNFCPFFSPIEWSFTD